MILRPIPLDTAVRNKYPANLEDYFIKDADSARCDCYEGDGELPWSFWRDDVDHLHPDVVCELFPRAWENNDDVLTTVIDEGGKHERYAYMLRSSLTNLLYIIDISENMGIERITQYLRHSQAEIGWAATLQAS